MALLYQSGFVASNGTMLPSVSPAIGPALVNGGGTDWQVFNNRAYITGGSGFNRTALTTPPNDYTSRWNLRFLGGSSGNAVQLLVRFGDSDNHYLVYVDGNGITPGKKIGGSFTFGSGYTWTPVVNQDYDIRVTINGGDIVVFLDGASVVAPTALTGRTGGQAAIFASPPSNPTTEGWHINSWEVDDVIYTGASSPARPLTHYAPGGGIYAGSSQVTRYAYLQQTDGTPKTDATHSTVSLHYTRAGGVPVAVTGASTTPGAAWTSGGFAAVDATNCPGLYRVDWPNAAFAPGSAESVELAVRGTGLRPSYELVPLGLPEVLFGGKAGSDATPTSIPTTGLPTLTAGQLNRRLLQFTSGACAGERVLIVGQTSSNTLQVAPPLTTAPGAGDEFVIL